MSRYDLPVGAALIGDKADQTYTDPDFTIKFFSLQKDFGDDQYMCVIQNGETGKALGFLLLYGEIEPFLNQIKNFQHRNKKLDYVRTFTDQHAPQRPVEITQNRFVLGAWQYNNK